MVQWNREPQFIAPFEFLFCVLLVANYHFFLPTLGIEPGLPASWNLPL